MRACEAMFQHARGDGPAADVLQGLLCPSGHTTSIPYCQPCYDHMLVEMGRGRRLLCHECYPFRRFQVSLLEAITL